MQPSSEPPSYGGVLFLLGILALLGVVNMIVRHTVSGPKAA